MLLFELLPLSLLLRQLNSQLLELLLLTTLQILQELTVGLFIGQLTLVELVLPLT